MPMRSSALVALATATLARASAPLPGLGDVCSELGADVPRCSPEICEMEAGVKVQLEAKTYYHDRPVVLPAGSELIGAGVNKTLVVSCGRPSSGRRGFLLGNHTYLGHLTWQGLQASRGNFD